ncbi:hypothetical protein ABN197_18490 [Providencia alcalifaciens]|uniref:hypothetical protein n=1 Tax=Providencia alcalifaciens TaxID=126385 RepID=UPI0032D9F19C
MATPLRMAAYHEAVLTALRALPWVNSVEMYPETVTPLVTPAVFFSVDGWEMDNHSDGQLRVTLSGSLWVLVDRATTSEIGRPEVYIRSAAADLTQWLDGQTFGLSMVEPAVFLSADVDETDPQLDDYWVWQVSFTQRVALGADPFATNNLPLQRVWLGITPDIGAQHVADYHLIYEGKSRE